MCRRFDLDIVEMNDRKLLFADGSASQGKHNGQSYIIPVDISSEPPGVMVLLVIILLTLSSHV